MFQFFGEKNKILLFIEGAKANQLKMEICTYMCSHSSETAVTLAEILELKHGQLSNEKAIKILLNKCDPHVELINLHAGNENGRLFVMEKTMMVLRL